MPTTEFFKNLKANQSQNSKKSGNDRKQVSINDNALFETMRTLVNKKKEADVLKAIIEPLDNEVRGRVLDEYEKVYHREERNPGTLDVHFTNTKGEKAHLMFIPTDGYKDIKPENVENLKKRYGSGLVQENMILSINEELFAKYEEAFAEFIATKIEAGDRESFVRFETEHCIKKGSYENLITLAKKVKGKIVDVIAEIGMKVTMRNICLDVEIPTVKAEKEKKSVKANA